MKRHMLALRDKAAVLALVLVGLVPGAAKADNLQGQPIYVQNNANSTIWVAARYIPPGHSSYVTDGFWKVEPGQRILMLYNNGVYMYIHARDAQGRVWRGNGNLIRAMVREETVNMYAENTSRGYDPWTITFFNR
jgi:uncharacterized membrane protein